ncbi:MAG: chorismate mutase, partial [Pseudoflavonifractor sp.]
MSELEAYRAQIDAVDAQIVALFCRRMEITAQVGAYKLRAKVPVMDAPRERAV